MPNNDYANEPNQSRSEDIIQSILDNTEYDEAARSRIEYLLIELKNAIEGGGGGGGVTSYSSLTEKPKIDNHTLQAGNNTSSDLGLQTKIDSDHKLSADNVDDTNSTNKFNVKSDWNATSGATSEILNKPTLGTASAKNVPASGNAATGEVVLGSDTRLTDARNAKDVYNWAKQENKPSYSYSEIQNTPTIPDELADLADDSTHRTVTDTEKTIWNGKQNALTFDDAPTSNSDNPVKSGGVYTALSAKQNNLSEAQMAAANSGITSTDVAQITTNKNNILLSADQSVIYNYYRQTETVSQTGVTVNSDGTITVNVNNTSDSYIALDLMDFSKVSIPNGDYYIYGCPPNGSDTTYRLDITRSGSTAVGEYGEGKEFNKNNTNPPTYFRLVIAPRTNVQNKTFRPMFIPKFVWDAGFRSYQPYALSNAELTAKEQTNENNILLAYGGIVRKNLLKENTVTFTGANRDIAAIPVKGEMVISLASAVSSDTDASTCTIIIYATDNSTIATKTLSRGAAWNSTFSTGDKTLGKIVVYSSDNYVHGSGDTATYTDMMVCLKSIYDNDPTYQPYALSNAELTAKEQVNENNILFNCVTGVNNVVVTPNLVNKVVSGITYNANSDGTISVTAGTPSANSDIEIPLPAGLSGDYILSGCPSGGTSGNWKTQICLLPNKTNVGEIYEDTSITVTLEADKSYIWRWRKYSGSNVPALTIKPMLAPAGLGAQSYVKGAMSNAELTAAIQALQAQLNQ